MADNTLQQENKSFRTEDIGGHQVQPVKLMLGADSVDDGNISANNPMPSVSESMLVSRGEVTGKTHVHIYGSNPDIDTGVAENIWAAGGIYTFPPAAETFNIVSTSPNDNGVTPNTGARSVRVYGLNSAYNEATEDVTLNGVTPVTTGIFTSIHRIEVLTAGSVGSNVGAISCIGNTSALTVANFGAGRNASSLGHYMVPAGKSAYVEKIIASTSRAASTAALITMQLKLFGADTVFLPIGEIGVDGGGVVYEFVTPPKLLAKSQLKFLAESLANNTTVSIFVELLLIND